MNTTTPLMPPAYISIDADIQPIGPNFDAFVLVCNSRTGEYTKKGRVFRCRNQASRWLRTQSAQVSL